MHVSCSFLMYFWVEVLHTFVRMTAAMATYVRFVDS
jgi:hypothetical protein